MIMRSAPMIVVTVSVFSLKAATGVNAANNDDMMSDDAFIIASLLKTRRIRNLKTCLWPHCHIAARGEA